MGMRMATCGENPYFAVSAAVCNMAPPAGRGVLLDAHQAADSVGCRNDAQQDAGAGGFRRRFDFVRHYLIPFLAATAWITLRTTSTMLPMGVSS